MPEVKGRIARKYMAHFLNVGKLCGGDADEYERLGKDLEEYNVELNPDTESKQNINGETTFVNNGYEVSSEADPYYAETDSVLSQKLQEIVDNRYSDDNCLTDSLEVHLWEEQEGKFVAWKQACYVIPNSYGGDTSGYQIPFGVNYVGERVKGLYDVETKTFTEGVAAAMAKAPRKQGLTD